MAKRTHGSARAGEVHSRRTFMARSTAAGLALALSSQRARAQTAAPSEASATGAAKLPNLILIVTDDQRWDSLGCMRNALVQTPNIDRLAQQGVVFENHFCTTSICMSSRASIFTGLHTRCHGIDDFSLALRPELMAQSYLTLLRNAGYYTGFVGKWGLGGEMPREGLDVFLGYAGQGAYFQEQGGGAHLTAQLGDQALEFLRGRPADRPFCLSVSFKAPHAQDEAPRPYPCDPRDEALYKEASIPLPPTARPEFFAAMPEFIRNSEGRRRWAQRFDTPEKFQASVKDYYRLISGVDREVGRLCDALRAINAAENTIIVYTSDNGCFLGERGLAGKWLMYEPSIRVPLVIYDPRRAAPLRRNEMTLLIDIMPTLLEWAGLARPPHVQGRSLVPLLDKAGATWRSDWPYEHTFDFGGKIPRSQGLRTPYYKYIRYIDTEPMLEELYDLVNDPAEARNLAPLTAYEHVLASFRARWQQWNAALDAWRLDATASAPWRDP